MFFQDADRCSFGYTILEAYSFPYERPVSGLRNRTICVARMAGDTAAA
jgi:hypothetical protein